MRVNEQRPVRPVAGLKALGVAGRVQGGMSRPDVPKEHPRCGTLAPQAPRAGVGESPRCGTPTVLDWMGFGVGGCLGTNPWASPIGTSGLEAAADRLRESGKSPQVAARALSLAASVKERMGLASDAALTRMERAATKLGGVLERLESERLSPRERRQLERNANRLMTTMDRMVQRCGEPVPPITNFPMPPWAELEILPMPMPRPWLDESLLGSDRMKWVGRPLSEVGGELGSARVIRPGGVVTMDYNPRRLNVQVDERDVVLNVHYG